MPLNLIVLMSYFAIEPESITGGIGYRFVGLYGSLAKALLNHSPESKIFFYSNADRCLRLITRKKTSKSRSSMLKAVLGAISTTLKSRSYLVAVVAYPYAVPSVPTVWEYILSLLALKVFGLGRIRVVADDIDPPVEGAFAFSEAGPSTATILYWRILDMLTLKLASFTITLSESFKQYIAKIYRIKGEKILIVPSGSLVRYISYVPPKYGSLTILYSGSAMKVKDINKLFLAVNRAREKGLKLSLVLTGAKLMNIPSSEWVVHKTVDNWRSYVKNCLELSDVGVIPYPRRLFWDYQLLTKLFDYMAAGKPIISTNLKETGNIIRMFNCGLVARDWEEFELHLERLYHDREFAKKLGENGRRATEKYFNYELLSEALLISLLKHLKMSNAGEG